MSQIQHLPVARITLARAIPLYDELDVIRANEGLVAFDLSTGEGTKDDQVSFRR